MKAVQVLFAAGLTLLSVAGIVSGKAETQEQQEQAVKAADSDFDMSAFANSPLADLIDMEKLREAFQNSDPDALQALFDVLGDGEGLGSILDDVASESDAKDASEDEARNAEL
jgi:hypothetical protein